MTKILAGVLLILSGYTRNAIAQHFDQLTRPVAILSDSTQIWPILDALLIPAVGRVDRVEIMDVTANGLGPNDLVILYPTMDTYEIGDHVPLLLQESMKSWAVAADYRLDATRQEGRRLSSDAHLSQDVRAALTADILGTVAHYYEGDEFDLYMSQNAESVRLEIWNYDPDAMRYRSPLGPTSRDTLWQAFQFAAPAVVMAFKDASDCIETHADQSRVRTRPCE